MRIKSRAELIINLEAVAAKLAGRPVTIRLCKPAGLMGRMYKNMQDACVIDLDPALLNDARTFAETFTHEIAHAKKHFASMPRVDVDAAPKVSEAIAQAVYAARYKRPADRRHEAEADALAAQWMKAYYAHYPSYLMACEDEPIYAVLQVLYHKA